MNAIPRSSVAALSLACALAASCHGSGPQTSGNTNWLRACASDASCDGAGSCVCGVCTRPCDRGNECATIADDVQCVDPGTGDADNGCAAQVMGEHQGVCLRVCGSTADCDADQSCEDGSCIATAAAMQPRSPPDRFPDDSTSATNAGCDATLASCDASSGLRAVIEQSRSATTPANPDARVWSCEAGAVRIDPGGYDDAFAIAIADDSLLVAGVATAGGDGAWRIERRSTADLSPAGAFGTRGVVTSGRTERWDSSSSLVADATFMYVAGVDGYDHPEGGTLRVEKRELASGALVADFGSVGAIAPSFGGVRARRAMGHGLALDATDLYLAGAAFGVEKRRAVDGALVAGFGQAGLAVSAAAPDSLATAVVLRDGVLYAAGSEGAEDLRLEARDADSGALLYETTEDFDDGGCAPECVVSALVPGEEDALYLATTAAGRWRIERRTRSLGTLVYAQQLEASGSCDAASAIAIDDSAMYVAGWFGEHWRIEKRALADGELVAAFGQGGVIEPGLRGAASAIALQGDVLYVAGIEGPRAGLQSSVWRIERRGAADGSLIECPAGAPDVPRAPECESLPVIADAPASEGSPCDVRVASSSACAVANVRASTLASAVEDWTLPEGAALEDGSFATVELAGEPSSFLVLRGFGLSLPEHARVFGIALDVTRASADPGSISDEAVRLVRGGRILDADRSLPQPWSTSLSHAKYGGPSDPWDSTWSVADLNDPSFGVALRAAPILGAPHAEASFEAVRVDVYYCE